jgi:hypothetical protein
MYGEKRNTNRFWCGNLKRPFGRPRDSWEDTEIDLKELGWKGMDWINVAHDRDKRWYLLNMVMHM